tara:strand:+ start:11966 stop:12409 length:444 start_codon:yes stop_codon:yes gene_type:complete
MSKIKRSVLKQLIKECLVEILIEGIDSEPGTEALVEAARPRHINKSSPDMERIQKNRDLLDSKKVSKSGINETVINNVTSDPLMAEILRDTASTTLMSQGMSNSITSDRRAISGDLATQAVANNDIEQLFEGSENWATLAFDKPQKK